MYFEIKDFKQGLDTRKSVLTSVPGTLATLQDMHINQGGEIEKRLAFLQQGLPNQVYGFQETTTGIYVFGSRSITPVAVLTAAVINGVGQVVFSAIPYTGVVPTVGSWITIAGSGLTGVNGNWQVTGVIYNSGALIITWNTPGSPNNAEGPAATMAPYFAPPVTYQQLTHPLGSSISMTGVVSSTYFNNQCLVVTTWSNGDTLEFYGSSVVTDFYYGVFGSIENTPQAMATDLVAQVNASGAYTANLTPLTSYLYIQINGGATGNIANVGYNFNRGVTLIETSGNPGSTDNNTIFYLTAAPVNWTTSNAATATALVTAINTNASSGGANAWGFVAARGDSIGLATNIVIITPPATDAFGVALGRNALDTMTIIVGGDVIIYNPAQQAVFDIFSIPSQSSPNPYSVTTTTTDAELTYQLISNGVAGTQGTGAVAQFAITAGTSNPPAIATVSISGTPANNDTITIGSQTYTFVTIVTGVANQVLIDANSLANLVSAINATSNPGKYSTSTLANPDASSSGVAAGSITLTATIGGNPAVALTLSTTSAALTVGAFAGGGDYANGWLSYNNGTNVSNNDTVTLNGKVYTFQTVLTNTDGHVLIGGNSAASLLNLLMAVNLATPAAGHYAAATTLHPTMSALNQDTTNFKTYFRAKASGTGGNALTLAKSAATLAVSGATLANGGNDTNQITSATIGGVTLFPSAVQFNQSVNQTASDLVGAINAYQGTSGFTASAVLGVVTITAINPGASFNNTVLSIVAAGNVCVASSYFTISGAGAITIIAGNLAANMLTSTLTYQDTGHSTENFNQFTQRVVDNINFNTSVSGYVACLQSGALYLSAANIASTNVAEAIVVTASLGINSGVTTNLNATANATNAVYTWQHGLGWNAQQGPWVGITNVIQITVTGGTPPYIYTWSALGISPLAKISAVNQSSAYWTDAYLGPFPFANSQTDAWQCVVTDSNSLGAKTFTVGPIYTITPINP